MYSFGRTIQCDPSLLNSGNDCICLWTGWPSYKQTHSVCTHVHPYGAWPHHVQHVYRQCDLWHVYKRATEPRLPADTICTQLNGRKQKKSNILWRYHCLIFINFWYDERGHISKLVQPLLSQLLGLCGNYDTKCKLSHRTSAVFCLPD